MSEPTNLWNAAYEASPAGTDLISNGDDEIRGFKKDIRERHEREHVRDSSDKTLDGLHREGSARVYYDASEPTDRPDGTSLDSNDEGRLWYDSDNDILYVWTGGAWEEVVDDAAYVKLTGNQTIAGEKTFEDTVTFEGEINFDGAFGKGRVPTGTLHGTKSENAIFDALAPSIPNVNDKVIVSGGASDYIISYAERTSSNEITLYSTDIGELNAISIEDGKVAILDVSMAW